MSEMRVDPVDRGAYTYEQIASHYKGSYKPEDIDEYWHTMVPVKGKGKGAGYPPRSSKAFKIIDPKTKAPIPVVQDLPQGVTYLEIDGSFGEGGGQVLRNTFAYAAVLGKPIHITKIRNGRPKPGLANQHLTGISAVSELSCGALYGAAVRSMEVYFVPPSAAASAPIELVADCGTAGALTLVLQSILPVLALGSRGAATRTQTVVTCKGGTDVPFSPAMDYFRDVTLPNLSHFGVKASLEIVTRGIMPKGGGVVNVSCMPLARLEPMKLVDFGTIVSAKVSTLYCGANMPEDVANELSSLTAALMQSSCGIQADEDVQVMGPLSEAPSSYLSVSVTVQTSTGCVLNGNALHSARKVSPAALSQEACKPLIANIAREACLDEHCADQVILFMALAAGESIFRTGPLTEHTRTAIHFAEVCTGASFRVEPVQDGKPDLFEVACTGIGWQSQGE